jgi:hypothetical protein
VSTRFLTVLGVSGSGKSSLVCSGLIPSLDGGAMTRPEQAGEWRSLRRGNKPPGNLASSEALGEGKSAELTQAFFESTRVDLDLSSGGWAMADAEGDLTLNGTRVWRV